MVLIGRRQRTPLLGWVERVLSAGRPSAGLVVGGQGGGGGARGGASTWQQRVGHVPGTSGGCWWLVSGGPGRTDPTHCWPDGLQPPSSAGTFPEEATRGKQSTTRYIRVNSILKINPIKTWQLTVIMRSVTKAD